MSLSEETSSDWARRSTKCPVREVFVLLFHRTEVEMKWKMTTKKRAFERLCSNARCIGDGKLALLLLAFVAFVHSLDDGFGQIERGVGKKHVVSLF